MKLNFFDDSFAAEEMSFKTWEQTLGYVFGSSLKAFEEGHFPSDFDVTITFNIVQCLI